MFLDRDGTINLEKGYVHSIEDFEFIPGVPQAIKLLKNGGFLVIVVTNQSGVARGYYPLAAVHRLHGYLSDQLAGFGTGVDAYYICPHHLQGTVIDYAIACSCRKPLPGMIIQAAEDFTIDLARSYMIGDKQSDVEAGLAARCRPMLLATGHGPDQLPVTRASVACYENLLQAARAIVMPDCGAVAGVINNCLQS